MRLIEGLGFTFEELREIQGFGRYGTYGTSVCQHFSPFGVFSLAAREGGEVAPKERGRRVFLGISGHQPRNFTP